MPLNQYFKGKIRNKGFTLIELLIVVAIIAILVGIGATRYQDAVRKGRDAQRKSDLRSIATALEQYYSDKSNYPQTDSGPSGKITCGDPLVALDWGTSTFQCDSDGPGGNDPVVYSGTLPQEPTGTDQYYYQAKRVTNIYLPSCDNSTAPIDCQRYILAAQLENDKDPERDDGCFDTGGASPIFYDFCITNP